MYESPINIITKSIQTKAMEEQDKYILKEIHNCGININKDELIKALMYDRQQYEKGYTDAKLENRWIPCSEKLPDKYDEYQVTWTTSASSRHFISNIEYTESGWICDIYMMNYPNIAIIAWKPLPEPYRGE